MSGQRTATAASGNRQLSVFSSAIRTAALGDELNSMRSFTLFVPVNSAFAALSPAQRDFLRDPANRRLSGRRVLQKVAPWLRASAGESARCNRALADHR